MFGSSKQGGLKWPAPAVLVVVCVIVPLTWYAAQSQVGETSYPTFLAIAKKEGTDKVTRHSYNRLYETALRDIRHRPINMLEIGLGCNMEYGPGASLKVWETYFTHRDSRINFMEYDAACAKKWMSALRRGRLYIGSQDDPAALAEIVNDPSNENGFDLIVDDGGHSMFQHAASFNALWKTIKPGGMYVIEDLETAYVPSYGGGPPGTKNTTVSLVKDYLDMMFAQNCSFYPQLPCKELMAITCIEQAVMFTKL